MNNPPEGKTVLCPECRERAIAIIPEGGKIVEQEANADGKVWVNCRNCGNRFITRYQLDESGDGARGEEG